MFARVVVVYCVKIVPSCLAKDTLLHHFHEKHPERDVIHVIFPSLIHSFFCLLCSNTFRRSKLRL